MATAQTIINRSGRMLGLCEPNTTLDSSVSADFLVALKALMESMQNDKLLTYDVIETTKTMVVGQETYTIGSGGDFNIERPVFLEGMYVTANGIDYPPMTELTPAQYATIPQKQTSTSDIPNYYKFETTYPLASVTVYPSPSTTNILNLRSYYIVTALSSLSTSIALPPGYEDTLAYNLAEAMLPEYPQASTGIQIVLNKAKETRSALKRLNSIAPIMQTTQLNAIGKRGKSDIYTGT